MSELYHDRLSKKPAVQRDVRKGVKGDVGAEVGGVRNLKWNRVSPDNTHLVTFFTILYFYFISFLLPLIALLQGYIAIHAATI